MRRTLPARGRRRVERLLFPEATREGNPCAYRSRVKSHSGVALVLRPVIRQAGDGPLEQHWTGPPADLARIQRLAGTATAGP